MLHFEQKGCIHDNLFYKGLLTHIYRDCPNIVKVAVSSTLTTIPKYITRKLTIIKKIIRKVEFRYV